MNVKKILAALLILIYASSAFGADGDVDILCKQVEDLNAAGGCIAADDVDEPIVSAGVVFLIQVTALAALIVIVAILRWMGFSIKRRQA